MAFAGKRDLTTMLRGALALFGAFVLAGTLAGCACSKEASSEEQASTSSEATQESGEQASSGGEAASSADSSSTADDEATQASTNGIDYLLLVNREDENVIPDDWYDKIELIDVENRLGETYTVEKTTYDAYLAARDELEAEGIIANLNSAYRSKETQQEIFDEYAASEGEDYAATHVALPGHSEHETGLAIDVILIDDGVELRTLEQMEAVPELMKELENVMAKHGFIRRYLEGKEDITGYDPELWHFRYIGSPEVAQEIMGQGLTLEEYLGAV